MQLSDKIKKFSVEQAIDYLNRNPVKNLPKLTGRTRSAPESLRASAAPSRSKATRRRRTAAAAKKK